MAEVNLEIPKIWKELLKKKEWLGEGDIAGCFCPGFDDGKEWFSNYFGTDDLALLSRLVYLGQADGTGAAYAILIVDEKKPLEENPVIFIDSEAFVLLASSNLIGLLQLLSIGVDPMGFESDEEIMELTFCPDEEREGFYLDDFREWLESKGIKPIDLENGEEEGRKIVRQAMAKYGKELEKFLIDSGYE